jgi:hypothetical protein
MCGPATSLSAHSPPRPTSFAALSPAALPRSLIGVVDPHISRYLSGLTRLDASSGCGATGQLLQPTLLSSYSLPCGPSWSESSPSSLTETPHGAPPRSPAGRLDHAPSPLFSQWGPGHLPSTIKSSRANRPDWRMSPLRGIGCVGMSRSAVEESSGALALTPRMVDGELL